MSSPECALCDVELCDTNDSKEHLLPNAIGGRSKIKGFICNESNNKSGNSWELELAKQLNSHFSPIHTEPLMETILGLCIGIGLSAACGFRVFVPLLVMSVASLWGWFEPMQGFEWLALPAVCFGLAVATLCEIAAYYIPWVDNILDTVSTPAAMVAGTLATMAVSSGEMSQFASWAAAIIVGGGTAGAVQMSTVAVRALSTATTGGIGNPVVSTGEWMGALLLSVVALIMPVLVVIVVVIMALWALRWFKRRKSLQT